MSRNSLSLSDLNGIIRETLKIHTDRNYWIVAEIHELKVNTSGHCYLELVEKEEHSEKILARNRATIWAPNYRMIKPYFETTTKQSLSVGLSIMIRVSVEFHELYGLSLNVTDIEPTYTVGELALQKQRIIDRLTDEGVMDMNKELLLPEPCNRIAVISSATAAGYGDFCGQLLNNSYGYKFYTKLFPATMQGNQAEESIISALEKVFTYEDIFDTVVLIRGGGSQTDLSCFNSYWLAYNISQFPLPVLTGIGHEQDDTVADLVAHTRLKTPTAVAAFLVDNMVMLEEELAEIIGELSSTVTGFMDANRAALNQTASEIRYSATRLLARTGDYLRRSAGEIRYHSLRSVQQNNYLLRDFSSSVHNRTRQILDKQNNFVQLKVHLMKTLLRHTLGNQRNLLNGASEKSTYLDPKQLLRRGYSITTHKGRLVKAADEVDNSDQIETILFKGTIKSTVNKK